MRNVLILRPSSVVYAVPIVVRARLWDGGCSWAQIVPASSIGSFYLEGNCYLFLDIELPPPRIRTAVRRHPRLCGTWCRYKLLVCTRAPWRSWCTAFVGLVVPVIIVCSVANISVVACIWPTVVCDTCHTCGCASHVKVIRPKILVFASSGCYFHVKSKLVMHVYWICPDIVIATIAAWSRCDKTRHRWCSGSGVCRTHFPWLNRTRTVPSNSSVSWQPEANIVCRTMTQIQKVTVWSRSFAYRVASATGNRNCDSLSACGGLTISPYSCYLEGVCFLDVGRGDREVWQAISGNFACVSGTVRDNCAPGSCWDRSYKCIGVRSWTSNWQGHWCLETCSIRHWKTRVTADNTTNIKFVRTKRLTLSSICIDSSVKCVWLMTCSICRLC